MFCVDPEVRDLPFHRLWIAETPQVGAPRNACPQVPHIFVHAPEDSLQPTIAGNDDDDEEKQGESDATAERETLTPKAVPRVTELFPDEASSFAVSTAEPGELRETRKRSNLQKFAELEAQEANGDNDDEEEDQDMDNFFDAEDAPAGPGRAPIRQFPESSTNPNYGANGGDVGPDPAQHRERQSEGYRSGARARVEGGGFRHAISARITRSLGALYESDSSGSDN